MHFPRSILIHGPVGLTEKSEMDPGPKNWEIQHISGIDRESYCQAENDPKEKSGQFRVG